MFKHMLAFTLGAGIGSAVTYYILSQKFNDRLDIEMEIAKEHYLNKPTQNQNGEEPSDEIDTTKDYEGDATTLLPKLKDETSRYDYSAISKGEKEVMDEPVKKTTKKPANRKIYPITEDDWNEDCDYEKLIFTYFEDEDIFIDEAEQVVEDGKKRVGASNLKKIDDYEGGIMFIRNENTKEDIQIIFETHTYDEFVDGDY